MRSQPVNPYSRPTSCTLSNKAVIDVVCRLKIGYCVELILSFIILRVSPAQGSATGSDFLHEYFIVGNVNQTCGESLTDIAVYIHAFIPLLSVNYKNNVLLYICNVNLFLRMR